MLRRLLLDHRATPRQIDLLLLVMRVFFGVILVWGTQDNVFHREHMETFTRFVEQHGFPAPAFSAYLSAYAQFIAGIMVAFGLFTRLAAAVMAINFIVALAMVHVGLPFSANISPLSMLCFSVLLVIGGPGAWSLDARRRAQSDPTLRERRAGADEHQGGRENVHVPTPRPTGSRS